MKIELSAGTVTTLAGTGVQGNDKVGGKQGELQEISSPWDLGLAQSPGEEREGFVGLSVFVCSVFDNTSIIVVCPDKVFSQSHPLVCSL